MRNIKLTIEYDGTAYHGWQSQINATAVQDVVASAVSSLTGENCSVTGSSRTDTGVHALGQVCNFHTNSPIPADKFAYALNTLLPEDIVIRKSEDVPDGFHARFSARGKKYRYLFYNSVFPSALLRNRAFHVYYPLDIAAMHKAAGCFTGTHDFAAFSAAGGSVKTTVRTITEAAVVRDDELVGFTVAGDGFLYNMVRIIAGTLVEVGFGRIKADDIPEIIDSCDRKRAGRTAPAHGLYLVEVYY
ncbi:MAG: tRNA pseudouridine(38-40) synthase TruA [Clostridiaceae bacterium]